MPRHRQPVDPHKTIDQVIALEQTEKILWKRQRLQAVRLAAEGHENLARVAAIVGITAASLYKWLAWYRKGGIEMLLDHKNGAKGGKAARFSEAQWEKFRQAVAEKLWRTARQAQKWLKDDLGLTIALKEVYRHMGKLGARLKVARRSHVKKDHVAAQAFKEGGLERQVEELNLPKGKALRFWICDEARFGLHTEHRRVWSLRGLRPVMPHQQRYEWDYVYGAVGIGHAGSVFHYQPTVSLENYSHFLNDIGKQNPGVIHIVIQDGAGFHHRDGDHRVPANVRLITLPAYSPELNPVEKLWDQIKDTTCNEVFASVEDLRSTITKWLQGFWNDPARALSLVGSGWLRDQANAAAKN
jgi:transposase